jgi:hypothetical protein
VITVHHGGDEINIIQNRGLLMHCKKYKQKPGSGDYRKENFSDSFLTITEVRPFFNGFSDCPIIASA